MGDVETIPTGNADTASNKGTGTILGRGWSRRRVLVVGAGLCAGGVLLPKAVQMLRDNDPRQGLSVVFEDDFDDPASIDIDGTNTQAKWFTDLPWRESRTPAECVGVADSVLLLNQVEETGNWAVASRSPWTGRGRIFKYGYYEARLAFESAPEYPTDGFPAFWSLPVGQQNYTPDRHYVEIDFFEAMTEPGERYDGHFSGVVHDIHLTESYEQEYRWFNLNNRSKRPVVLDDGWHTYGCYWEPGRLRWYFDDRLMHEVVYRRDRTPSSPVMRFPTGEKNGPKGLFTVADEVEGVSVILGTAPGWPVRVDWVRIWA